MDDIEKGKELADRFLRMCEFEEVTGTAILNAVGNIMVGFMHAARFESHSDRMTECKAWCKSLQREVDAARRQYQ